MQQYSTCLHTFSALRIMLWIIIFRISPIYLKILFSDSEDLKHINPSKYLLYFTFILYFTFSRITFYLRQITFKSFFLFAVLLYAKFCYSSRRYVFMTFYFTPIKLMKLMKRTFSFVILLLVIYNFHIILIWKNILAVYDWGKKRVKLELVSFTTT